MTEGPGSPRRFSFFSLLILLFTHALFLGGGFYAGYRYGMVVAPAMEGLEEIREWRRTIESIANGTGPEGFPRMIPGPEGGTEIPGLDALPGLSSDTSVNIMEALRILEEILPE